MDVILTLIPDSSLETVQYDQEMDVILILILDYLLATIQFTELTFPNRVYFSNDGSPFPRISTSTNLNTYILHPQPQLGIYFP